MNKQTRKSNRNQDGNITRQRILTYISNYWNSNGYAPGVREIASYIEQSTSVVNYHIEKLEAAGCVKRQPGIARTLRVVAGADSPSRG